MHREAVRKSNVDPKIHSPKATPRAGLAACTAGTGTEIGLTQSPTAVAMTSGGVVIVTEAVDFWRSAYGVHFTSMKAAISPLDPSDGGDS
jgi:hypothetical protein